jgi:hypothetical protein
VKTVRLLTLAFCFVLVLASPALAYVGPGAGLSVIGAALAFLGAIVLSIVGFVWYPIKRVLRRRAARSKPSGTPAET